MALLPTDSQSNAVEELVSMVMWQDGGGETMHQSVNCVFGARKKRLPLCGVIGGTLYKAMMGFGICNWKGIPMSTRGQKANAKLGKQ